MSTEDTIRKLIHKHDHLEDGERDEDLCPIVLQLLKERIKTRQDTYAIQLLDEARKVLNEKNLKKRRS